MTTKITCVLTFSDGLDERGAEAGSFHMAVTGPKGTQHAIVQGLACIVHAVGQREEVDGGFDAALYASIAFGCGYVAGLGDAALLRLCSGPLSVSDNGLWVEAFAAPNGQVIMSAWERLSKHARIKSDSAVIRIVHGTRWLRVAYGRAKDLASDG